MEAIIVTGMSGAGRTMAADCLEDMGYYCVDNMPPALLKNFVALAAMGNAPIEKACFVIDGRGGAFFGEIKSALNELKERNVAYQILFLDASDDTLIHRYQASRRSHPMSNGGTVQDGICQERKQLAELRTMADHVLDTTGMKKVDLNQAIAGCLDSSAADQKMDLTVSVRSFGYKYGVPLDADVVLDMRFLPNPFYVKTLKHLTGNNQKVRDYVLKSPEAKAFLASIEDLSKTMLPAYVREGKYHLDIAFGCTGGQHRSVTMAIVYSEWLKQEGYRVICTHRDVHDSGKE